LVLLIPPTLLVALLEVLGVASLPPFIALLADPDRFMKHRLLRWMQGTFAFSSRENLFFAVGLGILILLVASNFAAAAATWGMLRFAWMRNASLSSRLLRGYLARPYSFFLERNVIELLRRSWRTSGGRHQSDATFDGARRASLRRVPDRRCVVRLNR
jgi:hypothetical protein